GWRAYLQKLAEKPKLLAVRITAPTPAIGPADAHIHFADRHAPAGWAQHPALHQLGFGMRVPDQFPRRAETAHDAYFAIARQRNFQRLRHGNSPLMTASWLLCLAALHRWFRLQVPQQGIQARIVRFPDGAMALQPRHRVCHRPYLQTA